MKVKELIENLSKENPDARLCVYDKAGEPVELNRIVVADNDDDIATELHLYSVQ